MAKNKFSLDFSGFLGLAEELDEKYGTEALLKATEKALTETKRSVQMSIGKAMRESKYSFKKGEKYSQGRARESLKEVGELPVEVVGTKVIAYAGVDREVAPEVLMLANGTPELEKDKNLYNAIKVKGKVRKIVDRIQKETFDEALK